jgi:hypothetical protein
MSHIKLWLKYLPSILAGACLIFGLMGCKDINDNPPPEAPRLTVDLQDIQRQLGYVMSPNGSHRATEPDRAIAILENDVTTPALSLLVGAIVVSNRNTPYTSDIAINRSIDLFFGSDLTSSGEYLRIIDLPTATGTVEFKVPPPSAGQWQVLAIALSSRPKLVSQLSDAEHKDAAIYYGIAGRFFSSDDIGRTPIPLKLKRVCLLDSPPKGCASFARTITGAPVVTTAVEIVGVKVNGNDFTSTQVDLPIFVHNDADVATARSKLATIRDEVRALGTVSSLTVRATHTQNPDETEGCRALSDVTNENEFTAMQLRTHCDVSEYSAHY